MGLRHGKHRSHPPSTTDNHHPVKDIKKVVVVGGGLLGRHVATDLDALFDVTFIQAQPEDNGAMIPVECLIKVRVQLRSR